MGHALPYTVAIRYRRERAIMAYSMRWVREHVEVYDHTGRFLFSADSESEARRELEEDFHAAA